MYGNGGGSAASTAGGSATQPSAPKTNPVEIAIQQESMGLQLKQIEAQNRLANAQATTQQLSELSMMENIILHCVDIGMEKGETYKEIYQYSKKQLETFKAVAFLE